MVNQIRGELSTLQRYNLRNALSSISGYILHRNAFLKSISQNIKTIQRNDEGERNQAPERPLLFHSTIQPFSSLKQG